MHTPFAVLPGDEQDPRDEHGNVVYDDGITLVDTWRAMESLVDEGAPRRIAGRATCAAQRARRSVRSDMRGRTPAALQAKYLATRPQSREWQAKPTSSGGTAEVEQAHAGASAPTAYGSPRSEGTVAARDTLQMPCRFDQ
jgi:hypothetical protein